MGVEVDSRCNEAIERERVAMDEPRSRRHPEWVYRKKEIPGAGELWVPAYIYRIDKATPRRGEGGGGTAHGWQVRYGKPSAFFSDYLAETADNGKADPMASLAMAEAYLSSIWSGRKGEIGAQEERSHKKFALGMSGLSLRIKYRSNGAGTMCHVCELRVISHTGAVLRYLYVGVVNKLTLDRLMSVIEIGRLLRMNHLKELGIPVYEEPECDPETLLRGTPLEHLIPDSSSDSDIRKRARRLPSIEEIADESYDAEFAAHALTAGDLGKKRGNFHHSRKNGLASVKLPAID